MSNFNSSSMCDVVDITLYKNNYYDNLIFTKCLNQIDYAVVNEESILVTPNQIRALFELNFERELRKIEATTTDLLHYDANSIFFIDRLLQDFNNLKWIKLNLAKTRNYSRVVDINGQKNIKFTFKILKSTLRLNQLFDIDEIQRINHILMHHGLLNKKKPYNITSVQQVIHALDMAINLDDNIDDDTAALLMRIVDTFEYKFEIDNPELLLVTDW